MSIDPARRQHVEAEVRRWASVTALVLTFTATLHLAYQYKVSPSYAYEGFTYRSPNPMHYALAIGLVVVIALVLPRTILSASHFVLWLLFTVGAAPAILLSQYMNTLPPPQADRLSLSVAACMLMVRVLSKARPGLGPRFGPILVPSQVVWYLLGAFTVATYVGVMVTAGLRFEFVDLFAGYDLRANFATATSGTLLGYALPWVFNVVNPVFMAYGIYARRYAVLAFGTIGQYVIFASTGQKGVLFSIAGVGLIAMLFRWRPKPPGVAILGGVTIMAVAAVGLDKILGGATWTTLFVRRFVIIPGALVVAYVAVFTNRPSLWFSSLYSSTAADTLAPSLIVGRVFIGDETTNANVSLFGDGFVQAGYLGMFIESFVLVLLLWAMDYTTRGLPIRVSAIVLFMPTVAVASGSIFTVTATHGLGIAILVCAVLPRDCWDALPRAARRGRRRNSSPDDVDARPPEDRAVRDRSLSI